MNEYLKNLDRIEIVVTLACTGRCRHCQNGDPDNASGHIDPEAAVKAIRAVCARYEIRTLMTFGGEPLLRPEVVCAIHRAAADLGSAGGRSSPTAISPGTPPGSARRSGPWRTAGSTS